MSKVLIRKMTIRDLAEVSELALLANPHAVKEEYKKQLKDLLKNQPDLSFVAVMDGRVVGYVMAAVHDSMAVIEDIAVNKKFQGMGVGGKLLREELQVLKRKNVRLVFAEVHYKCASAIPFYYKFGFRIAGFQQDYFGAGHDAIILKLEL
jgi:ribosomal protein S18 acetylase RimI-like enzyme